MKTPLGIPPTPSADSLHTELRTLIAAGRQRLAGTVNAEFTRLYWAVGERLRRMIKFAELFPDAEIVASVMRQLSWTHFLQLLPLKDPQARAFYVRLSATEGWSVGELRRRIGIPPRPPFAKGGASQMVSEASATFNNTSAPIPPFTKGGLGGIRHNSGLAGVVALVTRAPLSWILAKSDALVEFDQKKDCAEASREQVELLRMQQDGITVAEYWTELPPKEELKRHLHQALIEARERLAARRVLMAAECGGDVVGEGET